MHSAFACRLALAAFFCRAAFAGEEPAVEKKAQAATQVYVRTAPPGAAPSSIGRRPGSGSGPASTAAFMAGLLALGVLFWAIDMPSGPGRWIGVIMMGTVAALLLLHLVMSSRAVKRRAKGLLALPLFAWLEGRLVEKASAVAATSAPTARRMGERGCGSRAAIIGGLRRWIDVI